MPEHAIICIGCPLGCRVTLEVSGEGEVESLTGNQCKEGKRYVLSEFKSPERVFTATVLTETGHPFLPVRTDKPVPKSQLREIMQAIAKLRISPPVQIGQVIIKDILGTGANLVATSAI